MFLKRFGLTDIADLPDSEALMERIKTLYAENETSTELFNNYEIKEVEETFERRDMKREELSIEEIDSKIKKAMENWYREKTLAKVKERVSYYSSYFNNEVTTVKVKEQKKRWASCTSKNELLFNWRCVMAPVFVLDYIVVHEMCHMEYKNHSKDFWNRVYAVMPDYEVRKDWLRDYGIRLNM